MNVDDDKFQYTVLCRNKTISDEYISVGSNKVMLINYLECILTIN